MRSVSRNKRVSRAGRVYCQLAVRKPGYPAAEVAWLLGATTSAIVRAAVQRICLELKIIFKFIQNQRALLTLG
ncbi:MAG: hypothetical protein HWN70_12875 [Desulfobacterales bacterium]|nr:hypothetical protein [Desulfobacterales bacterium]